MVQIVLAISLNTPGQFSLQLRPLNVSNPAEHI